MVLVSSLYDNISIDKISITHEFFPIAVQMYVNASKMLLNLYQNPRSAPQEIERRMMQVYISKSHFLCLVCNMYSADQV